MILVRIRIRLTNIDGEALPKRTAISRRKHLCKDWWNNDWLNRVLATCQYLAEDGKITIGERQEEQVIINAIPFHVNAPVSINEAVLDQLSYERSELSAVQKDSELNEHTDEDEAKDD